MFKTMIGDLFTSRAQTLVNTVNCVGIMGKGVAAEFRKRFPAMFDDYQARCERQEVRLGEPYLYRDLGGTSIVNFPTKQHWRSPTHVADIEAGLDFLVGHIAEWRITSVALPPLGCGNGGLDWIEVGPLIYRKLRDAGIDVELYAPYGTPRSELTEAFLAAPVQLSLEGKGRQPDKLNPAWIVLVEVLRELQRQPYANPVGRTIFQNIAHLLTEMGVQTDFKPALHELANRNWLQEQPLGRMTTLRIGPQYEKDRGKFRDVIATNERTIAKTVDLFSRIKTTEQAEEVLTVLLASRALKRQHPGKQVGEQQLYDYVLDGKKSWRNEEKRLGVAAAIRHLVMLGWMKLAFSEALPEAN
jgi:O-acetyl-ADP-ribose deacetylase (regulator of RNase III)